MNFNLDVHMVNAVISGYVLLKDKLNLVESRECCLPYH